MDLTEEITFKIPIEWFDGWEVTNKETGEFLGWVNAKKKRIQKYVIKEIVRK